MLVVEDHAVMAESIRTMLESHKFAADVVLDGETGLDHLLRGCTMRRSLTSGFPAWTASR